MMRRPAVLNTLLFMVSFTALNCAATYGDLTVDDIPGFVGSSATSDTQPDWRTIDSLITLCEEQDGLQGLISLLDDSDARPDATIILGWMAYRIIESDPDSDLLFEIVSGIARMIDVPDETTQLAAINSIRIILSSEIDFDSDIDASERLGSVSTDNKYFAISIRACVGGGNSQFESVRSRTWEITADLGLAVYDGTYDPGDHDVQYDSVGYTFMTSVGYGEYANSWLRAMPLTLENRIEFQLDLAAYVPTTWDEGGFVGTTPSHYLFSLVFIDSTPEEIMGYLYHWSPTIRESARNSFWRHGDEGQAYVNQAYENGNARIKFDLIDIVNPEAALADKFELLEQVIQDDTLPVYGEDTQLLYLYARDNEINTPDDYPVDVMRLYLRLIESDSNSDRNIAIRGIRSLGEHASEAVPALIRLLEKPDADSGLRPGGPATGGADTDHAVVAATLGDIGPAASDAIPYLIELLDKDGLVSIYAASSLYFIGHNPDEMVALLVNRIRTEPNALLLQELANNLNRIGPDAIEAVPTLIELSDHPDTMTRYMARDAIESIEESTETVIRMMMERLDREDELERVEGTQELYQFIGWDEFDVVIPVLLELLEDESRLVRYQGCSLLVESGGYDEIVLPIIIEFIDPDSELGYQSVRLLPKIGRPLVDPAEHAVLRMLGCDGSNYVAWTISAYLELWGDTDSLFEGINNIEDQSIKDRALWLFNEFQAEQE